MANPHQIKFIHVLVGKLALPDDHYRDILSAYGVSSSTDEAFSVAMASEMIDGMLKMAHDRGIDMDMHPLAYATFKKSDVFDRLRKHGSRKGYATYGQLCKIVMLWWDVSEMTTDIGRWTALNKFVGNKWQIDSVEWLPIELVGRVIKTLEAMKGKTDG